MATYSSDRIFMEGVTPGASMTVPSEGDVVTATTPSGPEELEVLGIRYEELK